MSFVPACCFSKEPNYVPKDQYKTNCMQFPEKIQE